ncbi:Apoptotic protease-activating factor 1, partial [Trichinella murrelli]
LLWVRSKFNRIMLSEEQNLKLLNSQHSLLTDLEPKEITAYLQAAGVFSEDDIELINAKVTRRERVAELLTIYRRKARDLGPLVYALDKTGYRHLKIELVNSVSQVDRGAVPNSKHSLNILLINGKVPRKPEVYVERKEMKLKLKTALMRIDKEPGWIVLHGMGGCGKSVLAAAVVRDSEITGGLFSRVFWITAGRNCDRIRSFALMQDLYSKMGKEFHRLDSVEEASSRLIELMLFDYPRTLLILDDVWTESVVRLFDELQCRILALTRNASLFDVANNRKYFVLMEPSGYTRDEAMQAFASYLNCSESDLPLEALQIFHECRGHPLLISLIGALLKEHNSRWKFYYGLIHSQKLNNIKKVTHYKYATFNEAALLSLEDLTDDLKQLYFELAIFPLGVKISSQVLTVYWNKSIYEVEDIMAEFVKRSLLIKSSSDCEAVETYQIHALLHRTLHQKLLGNYLKVADDCWGKLPDHEYIFTFLGYHLFRADKFASFSDVFLNLKFLAKKIALCGPSSVLNDLIYYRKFIRDSHPTLFDQIERLIKNNSFQLATNNGKYLSLIHLSLLNKNLSELYLEAERILQESDSSAVVDGFAKPYLKSWCKQSFGKDPNFTFNWRLDVTAEENNLYRFRFLPGEIIKFKIAHLTQVCCTTTGLQLYRVVLNHVPNYLSFSDNDCTLFVAYGNYVGVFELDDHLKRSSTEQDDLDCQRTPSPILNHLCNGLGFIRANEQQQDQKHQDQQQQQQQQKVDENILGPKLLQVREFEVDDCGVELRFCLPARHYPWVLCCDMEGSAKILEISQGRVSGGLDLQSRRNDRSTTMHITSCGFNGDDSLLAIGRADGVVELWNPADFGLRCRFAGHHSGPVLFCAFTGRFTSVECIFSACERRILLWKFDHSRDHDNDLQQSNSVELLEKIQPDQKQVRIVCVALSPTENLLAASFTDFSVLIWNLENKLSTYLVGQCRILKQLYFSEKGKDLLAVREDNAVLIFNEIHKSNTSIPEINLIDFVEIKTALLLASVQDYTLQVSIITDTVGSVIETRRLFDRVSCLKWSPNECVLMIGFENGWIQSCQFDGNSLSELKKEFKTPQAPCCLAFSTVSDRFAVGCKEGCVAIQDAVIHCHGTAFFETAVTKCIFIDRHPHMNRLLICLQDGSFEILNIDSFVVEAVLGLPVCMIIDFDVNSNCTYLATCWSGKQVKVWELDNLNPIFEENNFNNSLSKCKLSQSGNLLAVCESRGMVNLFKLPGGDLVQKIYAHSADIYDLVFYDDDDVLITLSAELKWWNLKLKSNQMRHWLLSTDSAKTLNIFPGHNLLVTVDHMQGYHVMQIVSTGNLPVGRISASTSIPPLSSVFKLKFPCRCTYRVCIFNIAAQIQMRTLDAEIKHTESQSLTSKQFTLQNGCDILNQMFFLLRIDLGRLVIVEKFANASPPTIQNEQQLFDSLPAELQAILVTDDFGMQSISKFPNELINEDSFATFSTIFSEIPDDQSSTDHNDEPVPLDSAETLLRHVFDLYSQDEAEQLSAEEMDTTETEDPKKIPSEVKGKKSVAGRLASIFNIATQLYTNSHYFA